MPRFVRIGLAVFAALGLLTMSSCMMVGPGSFGGSSPTSSSLFGGRSGSGSSFWSGSHSLFGGSGSGGSRSSSGTYASSAASNPGDANSGGSVPPGYSPDSSESSALSSYLQSHRLPLVGAQVLTNDSGNRQVILYGFVATDFGKQDAADKARRYLRDPSLAVINRIAVRPQLLASGSSGSTTLPPPTIPPSSSGGGNVGSMQSYENQTQARQYMQNQSGLTALVPLIMMMGMMSFGNSNAGIGYGGGYPPTYGSPFGTPYSPYGAAPYASPYPPGYSGYGGGFTFP